MSDLVTRSDILDALVEKGQSSKRYKLGEFWELNLSEIKEAVESVPSAELELKWIPVTERLPINDVDVIVSVLDDSGDTPYRFTSVGWCTPNGQYWVVDNEMCYGVIAWMPLPEPWRGE